MNSRLTPARLIPLALAAALILGACQVEDQVAAELPTLEAPADETTTGTDETTTKDDAEVAEADAELAMAQFEACMSDAGVQVGTATADGGFVESFEGEPGETQEAGIGEIEAAMEECDSILGDTFGEFEASPEQQAEMDDANLEISRCLAEAGFDIDLSEGGFVLDETVDFAEFESAMKTCAPETQFGTEGPDQ